MRRRTLQILITGALLTLLLWQIDVPQLVRKLTQIDPLAGVAALALLLAQNDLTTRRWRVLLQAFTTAPSHLRMLRMQYAALFAQLFLPSSIGGAAVRAGMSYRAGVPMGVSVNSVLLDRIVALGGLVLMAAAFMPSIAYSLSIPNAPRVSSLVAAAGSAALLLAAALTLRRRHYARAYLVLKRTALRHLFDPLESAASRLLSLSTICRAFAFSIGGQVLAIGAVYALATGGGLNVHLLDCIMILPPVMFVSALPISIAGWGVREGGMVVAFGMLGVPSETALALSIQFALVGYVSATPGVVAWLLEANREEFRRSVDPSKRS